MLFVDVIKKNQKKKEKIPLKISTVEFFSENYLIIAFMKLSLAVDKLTIVELISVSILE